MKERSKRIRRQRGRWTQAIVDGRRRQVAGMVLVGSKASSKVKDPEDHLGKLIYAVVGTGIAVDLCEKLSAATS